MFLILCILHYKPSQLWWRGVWGVTLKDCKFLSYSVDTVLHFTWKIDGHSVDGIDGIHFLLTGALWLQKWGWTILMTWGRIHHGTSCPRPSK